METALLQALGISMTLLIHIPFLSVRNRTSFRTDSGGKVTFRDPLIWVQRHPSIALQKKLEETMRQQGAAYRRLLDEAMRPSIAVEKLEAAIRPSLANLQLLKDNFSGSLSRDSARRRPGGVTAEWAKVQTTIQAMVDTISAELDASDLSGIPERETSSDVESLTSPELSKTLSTLNESLARSSSLPEYLATLLNSLRPLTMPTKWILLSVILPYLVSVIASLTTPLVQQYWKQVRAVSRREAANSIRDAAPRSIDNAQLVSLRFVAASRLRLHSTAERKDDVIGELHFGTVVTIVDYNYARVLVEYIDDSTDRPSRGWVAARYLAKLPK